MKKISIVVPCYNEEESLPLFYEEVNKVTIQMKEKAEFEFVFVNDGSRDKTLEELKNKLIKCATDNNIRVICGNILSSISVTIHFCTNFYRGDRNEVNQKRCKEISEPDPLPCNGSSYDALRYSLSQILDRCCKVESIEKE